MRIHMNLFNYNDSAGHVYELLQKDQERGIRHRMFWQLAFLISGGLTISAIHKGSDWWNLAAAATLLSSYVAAYFMIETSSRNYCMHILTMLMHFERSKREA